MIEDPNILRVWQKILENELNSYLDNKYPNEMSIYKRFRKSTGPQCSFCKASARMIFKQEAIDNKNFLTDFANKNWKSYK